MSRFVASRFRRIMLWPVLGIIVSGVFVLGLGWMTTMRERRSSHPPRSASIMTEAEARVRDFNRNPTYLTTRCSRARDQRHPVRLEER